MFNIKLIMKLALRRIIAVSVLLILEANAVSSIKTKKLVILCKTLALCVNNYPYKTKATNADVSLHYRYSNHNGVGKDFSLKNGDTLYNNDRFTIEIVAHKSIYLYLFHIDSSGNIKELLYQSEQSNSLIKGQNLLLPGSIFWPAFDLDRQPGVEIIYAIVASKPRLDLIKIHGKKETDDLTITCQCGDPCVEPFIIKHLTRD